MNGPEIQKLIDDDLRRTVARAGDPPAQEPLEVSPWVAISTMQKAIRRARIDIARAAAATLLRLAPDRLWRRLACIAVEDVGLGSLEAAGAATAAPAGKRKRMDMGGEWGVASNVIGALASAPKCRAADDLLMMCQQHPSLDRRWIELRDLATRDLIAIACGDGGVEERALALSSSLTSGARASGAPKRRELTEPVFDRLCEAGWPHSVVETARLNFNRTGVMLAPLVAMLARELPPQVLIEAEPTPPKIRIGGVPGWAFDIYSHEGRAAFALFLRSASATAVWLRRYVPASRRLTVLGHCVFRVEGGLVDRRLRWP